MAWCPEIRTVVHVTHVYYKIEWGLVTMIGLLEMDPLLVMWPLPIKSQYQLQAYQ